MRVALLHNHYSEQHLADVTTEMLTLGAPRIRAIYDPCYGMYIALEGSHRLRAAQSLGITPIMIVQDYDTIRELYVTDESLGLDIDNTGMTIEQLVDRAWEATTIEWDV